MSHSRFALGFTRNRKVFGLSDAAFRLYVSAIDWSREQRTDGVLTEKDMPAIPRLPRSWRAVALELTGAGLWHQLDDGWQIHDFLDWQDSADEVAVKQSRARERMRRVRANSERTSGEVLPGVSPISSLLDPDLDPGDPEEPESFSQAKAAAKPPKAKRRWRRCPEDFTPKLAHYELAKAVGVSLEAELPKFKDHEFRDAKTDADAAFRTWLRNAAEYRTSRVQGGQPTPPGREHHEQMQSEQAAQKARRLFAAAGKAQG